ncbi:MAG TPA: hypothetical protein VG146_06230 [Verrucomicrobiae bacterium]|nr:hypothetical protein [Verrucomicrobiae bacterium]
MKIQFKRFTRPQLLKRIGRDLLVRFFDQFAAHIKQSHIEMPGPHVGDEEYFGELARLLALPEALPDTLTEALFAIDDLSTSEGQEQLEMAIAQGGLALAPHPDGSREELALQVWLADPVLLARTHNQQQLRRLTAFEHFSAKPGERRDFTPPGQGALEVLSAELDPWFAQHLRGRNTTHVELYPLNGDYWFVVRHGDAFTRALTVEQQHTEVLHYRPERDDVIAYCPGRAELRINARTRGERELYRRKFGLWLLGCEDSFGCRSTYTLEPLRNEGPDALDAAGLDGIERIVLREIEIDWGGGFARRTIRMANDLFGSAAAANPPEEAIPKDGRLARAAFEILFRDCRKPRAVQIRLPNHLKVGRHCDAQRVELWLTRRGFRVENNGYL